MTRSFHVHAGLLALALLLVAAAAQMPLLRPLIGSNVPLSSLLLQETVLPRIAVALLGGAALALSGQLFQQVLRKTLAEPATLGVTGGAWLAITLAATMAPAWVDALRLPLALGGAGVAVLAVLSLGWRHGLSPVAVVLAGLVVGLYCNALATGLSLLNGQGLQGLFLWASGSLVQNGWAGARTLALALLIAVPLTAALRRPLALLDVGATQAAALGQSVPRLRLAALGLATALGAVTVAELGAIGFIGLAAPALARVAGARRLGSRLALAPPIGALLLWIADALAQDVSGPRVFPAGAAVALCGAPLLLLLLPRMRLHAEPPSPLRASQRLAHPGRWAAGAVLLLLAAVIVSLSFGQGPRGWEWRVWGELQPMLIWRLPRLLSAAIAGVMLAAAGTILQRLTANPMASPEMLGVSAGAGLGVIATLLLAPGFHPLLQAGGAVLGGLLPVSILLVLVGQRGVAPARALLAGLALTTLLGAGGAAFLASGDPRSLFLAQWLAGSTYLAGPREAILAAGVAVPLLLLLPLAGRWLLVLPLGPVAASGLGLRLPVVQGILVALAGLLTAAATLLIGPLSFVGLLAPHAARLLGLARPGGQLVGSALLAAIVMVVADWLGRVLLFPAQMPAGLVASLIGVPYLLWQMRRR